MYKKTYCDNYVEAIISMSAKILVNKSSSTPKIETSVMKRTQNLQVLHIIRIPRLGVFSKDLASEVKTLYQEIKKLYNRFPWINSPSSKFITCVTD